MRLLVPSLLVVSVAACNAIFDIEGPDGKLGASSKTASSSSSASSGTGGSGGQGGLGGQGGGIAPDDMAYVKAGEFDFTDGVAGPSVRAHLGHAMFVDKHEVTVERFAKWVSAGQQPPCNGGTSACALDTTGVYAVMVWDPGWNGFVADMTYASSACNQANNVPNPKPTWGAGDAQYPIVCANWYQAVAFCAFEGKRVLTETEWQYVATGAGTYAVHPWGDSGNVDCQHVIWDNSPSGDECKWPVAVGTASDGASRDGLFDLVGSVYEWGWDYHATYPVTSTHDYTGPATGSDRSTHGGSYAREGSDLEVHQRDSTDPGSPYADIGIRCALTVK